MVVDTKRQIPMIQTGKKYALVKSVLMRISIYFGVETVQMNNMSSN